MSDNCKTKFCASKIKEQQDSLRRFTQKLSKRIPDPKKRKAYLEDAYKNMKKNNERYQQMCEIAYCNPGCKNTVYQNGEFNNKDIKNALVKQNVKGKTLKEMIPLMKKMRKDIFKGKKTVLKKDFYVGLSNKDVKTLRKKGALSGCTIINM
jgi:hypothetical protein